MFVKSGFGQSCLAGIEGKYVMCFFTAMTPVLTAHSRFLLDTNSTCALSSLGVVAGRLVSSLMPRLPRPRHASQFSTELPSCAFLDIAFLHSSYLLRTSISTTVVPETIPITGTSVAHEASLPRANARHLALHGYYSFQKLSFLGKC